MLAICHAIAKLAERFPDRQFVYPVHPNPAVRDTVFGELGPGGRYANVHLIEPLEYLPFVLLDVARRTDPQRFRGRAGRSAEPRGARDRDA